MTRKSNAGRKPGFTMTDEHRQKIANSRILTCLIQHAEGTQEMSPSQVTAGLGLLKKVLPDLQAVQHSGEDGGALVIRVTLGGDS